MAKPKLIFILVMLIFSGFVNETKAFVFVAPLRCQNPNGRNGLCVSIFNCPSLLNVSKSNQSRALEFVRKCECTPNGQGRRPYVCCTSDTDFTKRNDLSENRIIFPQEADDSDDRKPGNASTTTNVPPTEKENYETLDSALFPKPPECGPVSIVNKIFGGEEAELGEFPWLANLEYKTSNGDLKSVCSGNIINHRYLLTVAHCIVGEITIAVGKLESVRIGDHNTQTPLDCNDSGCLDVFQRLGVKKTIVHNDYGSENIYSNYHDIALIKTDKNMQYSTSVAPVCLPNVLPTQMPKLGKGMKLSVAGWGHTGLSKYSAEKRKVTVPYVDNEDCPMKVGPEQLCAGGEFGKDSCSGDSGGGLVRLVRDCWIVEGLVSYGRGCGLEKPAVYTRVDSYIPWIQANVEP